MPAHKKGGVMHTVARSLGSVTICLGASIMFATAAIAGQLDHLEGYKGKDLSAVKPPASNVVTNGFGSGTCTLTKAQFLLAPSVKDNGDDPRGGVVGSFVCYKAKCTGPLPANTNAGTQFGSTTFASKKAQLVCLPATVCGDNVVEGTEQCDGTDASACPGQCQSDCTCPIVCPIASNTACNAYTSITACLDCCAVNSLCATYCTTAENLTCNNITDNANCAFEINSAGCASVCCP
jgi:hypothetical protein